MSSSPQDDNLRMALSSAGIGSWEWNPEEGGLLADTTLARMVGLEPEQVSGLSRLRSLIDSEDLSRLLAAAGRELIDEEIRIRRSDGSERLLAVRGAPLSADEERPVRLGGIAFDITEQRRVEEVRQRFRQASEAAARARNSLLFSIYPEIRTPLWAVLGGLEFMMGLELPDEQQDCLGMTYEAAFSLQRLLDHLVEFGRLQAGEIALGKSYFHLAKSAGDALESVVPEAAERDLGLKFQIDTHLPDAVVGDPHRVKQLITLLLQTAMRHTDEGEIALRIAPAEGKGAALGALITIASPDGELASRFGSELPRRRAEDPPPSGSDGLALAICRGLLDLMGGELEIRKTEEGTLLLASVPFDRFIRGEKPDQTAKILLAEDDPVIRELLEISLKKKNWTTVVAENGQKALAEWRKGDFDLLLIDVQMPEVDGLEVTRIIREQERRTGTHVPIVAITAHAREEDRNSCLAAGMDDYLSKPIRMGDLYQVVMRQLNQRGSKH